MLALVLRGCAPKRAPGNLPPWFDSEVRRLEKKQAWTKAKKFNKGHHWNKIRKVRN